MALYVISYDTRCSRSDASLHQLMLEWQAKRLLDSCWLAELRGPAELVESIVSSTLDGGEAVAVIELDPSAEWAAPKGRTDGLYWLSERIPPRG